MTLEQFCNSSQLGYSTFFICGYFFSGLISPLSAPGESALQPTHTVRISIYSSNRPPADCAPKVV